MFRPHHPLRLAPAAALLLLAVPSAGQLGTVTELGTPCTGGAGGYPNATCQRLRIDAPPALGLPPIHVEVRVIEPTAGTAFLGTVVLGSGGSGVEFYANQSGGDVIVQALLDAGARVVDRRWSYGWLDSSPFIKPQSVRYATLLQWVHDDVHAAGALGGAFGVSGNSGGAAEIGYALTTWGSDVLIDVAVLSAGLSLARADYLCTEPTLPAWSALCPALVPAGALECGAPPCNSATTSAICAAYPAGTTQQELLDDSAMHPGARLAFPKTVVHMVWGALDCEAATALGQYFHDSIDALKSYEYVPDTPHAVFSTPGGQAALIQRLTEGLIGPQTVTYCTAGTSAAGCSARLSAAGSASATAASGFVVRAGELEGQRDGLYFFGTAGRQANPWGSGTSFQCVVPPVSRAGLLPGTGTAGLCDGFLAQDLNALWCPTCPKSGKNPGAGARGQLQLWYRDPKSTSNQTTSLSNALEFCVLP